MQLRIIRSCSCESRIHCPRIFKNSTLYIYIRLMRKRVKNGTRILCNYVKEEMLSRRLEVSKISRIQFHYLKLIFLRSKITISIINLEFNFPKDDIIFQRFSRLPSTFQFREDLTGTLNCRQEIFLISWLNSRIPRSKRAN